MLFLDYLWKTIDLGTTMAQLMRENNWMICIYAAGDGDDARARKRQRETLMIMQGTSRKAMWLLLRSCVFMQVSILAWAGPPRQYGLEGIP